MLITDKHTSFALVDLEFQSFQGWCHQLGTSNKISLLFHIQTGGRPQTDGWMDRHGCYQTFCECHCNCIQKRQIQENPHFLCQRQFKMKGNRLMDLGHWLCITLPVSAIIPASIKINRFTMNSCEQLLTKLVKVPDVHLNPGLASLGSYWDTDLCINNSLTSESRSGTIEADLWSVQKIQG